MDLRYFKKELEKQSSITSSIGSLLRAAGRHPKLTLGAAGGLVVASQIPRLANRMLGLYLLTNEPRKRKIMQSQTDLLAGIKANQEFAPTIDKRRIPIKEDLV